MSSDVEEFQKIVENDLLKAPRFFEEIVNKSIELNLDTEISNKYATILLDHWKEASIYKKRIMAQEVSKINMVSKIVLTRQIKSKIGIPFESFMAKPTAPWSTRNSVSIFSRPANEYATAMGNNKNGRLGVGSDEEMIDDLRKIQIKGKIENVFMGENHTLFVLTNKDIYGCGKAKNFLERHENSELLISTPVKLNYVKGSYFTKVLVTDESTEFHEYNGDRTLIVGICSDDIPKISSGPNWSIVHKTERDSSDFLPPPITVELKNAKGKNVTIKVGTDSNHYDHYGDTTMAVIANGFPVPTGEMPMSFGVCYGGIIYASIDGMFYKGGLKFAPPEVVRLKRRITRSDNTDDDVILTDHIFKPRPDVLVAVLEEYIMPFSVKHFKVNPQGDSFIFYDAMKEPDHVNNLNIFWPTVKPKSVKPTNKERLKDGLRLVEKFQECIDTLPANWSDSLYDFTGTPTKGINVIHGFLILQHFLRIDDSKQLPEVFMRGLEVSGLFDGKTPNLYLSEKIINSELNESAIQCAEIPFFAVKAGWTRGEQEERFRQIQLKSKEFIMPLVGDVTVLLSKLINIPLSYRKHRIDEQFCIFVGNIIWYINESLDLIRNNVACYPSNLEFPLQNRINFKTDSSENALKEKIRMGDIDEKVSRFRTVRVEGIGRDVQSIERKLIMKNFVHYVNTNEIFIRSIDSSLLTEIDENRVLNLNKVCLNDKTGDRFRNLMDAFFLIKNDITSLRGYEKTYDVNSISAELPEEEKYKISSIEGSIIEVPKVLFELFSDFDSARRRHAEFNGEDVNSFTISFPENTIKAAMSVLIDSRTFFNLDMEMKLDVWNLSRFYLFSHLYKDLLYMIVVTAEEKDMDIIRRLFWENYEDMCEIVAEYRPDIILFWKEQTIPDDKFWMNLTQIGEKITEHHILKRCLGRFPLYSGDNEKLDDYRIDKKWLQKLFSNGAKDKDIQKEMMSTFYFWDVKLIHACSFFFDENRKQIPCDYSGTNHIWHQLEE